MPKYIVIRPGQKPTVETLSGLKELQAAVGGYIEHLTAIGGGLEMYVNEDGKSLNLPVNGYANYLFHVKYPIGLSPLDMIVGTVLLYGGNTGGGKDRDISQKYVREIVNEKEYKSWVH
jgi:hypothetical protein